MAGEQPGGRDAGAGPELEDRWHAIAAHVDQGILEGVVIGHIGADHLAYVSGSKWN